MRKILIGGGALLLLHCQGTEPPASEPLPGGTSGVANGGSATVGGGAGSATAGSSTGSGAGGLAVAGGGGGGVAGADSTAGTNAGGGGSGSGGAAGAAGSGGAGGGGAFALTSSEHSEGAEFADAFTCAGEGRSPALSWSAGPPATKSYAITFFDQSLLAMSSPNAYHWVIWDIPASTLSLPADLPSGATLTSPVAAKQSSPQNPFDQLPANSYFGPCPNALGNTDDEHTYAFTIHALGVETLNGSLSSVQSVDAAIQAATPLATAKLSGKSSARPD